MAANNKLVKQDDLRQRATAEIAKRKLKKQTIAELATDCGEDYALSVLALSVDYDSIGLPELKEFIAERPHLKELPHLTDDTLSCLLHKIATGSGTALLIRHEYEAMLKHLSLESDGPLEQLLVMRVVMTWLRLMYAENYKTGLMRGDVTIKQMEHADKDLSHAHTRYVRSIEALARVRKLVKVAEMADTQSRLLKERLDKPAPRLSIAKGA
jgi:hypothetical protein